MSTKKQQKPLSRKVPSVTLKGLRYKLELFDGFWSIPLAFLLFAVSGTVSVAYFGDALISTEYVQYIVLAAMIMVFANFVVFLGIRFNFRALCTSTATVNHWASMVLLIWPPKQLTSHRLDLLQQQWVQVPLA